MPNFGRRKSMDSKAARGKVGVAGVEAAETRLQQFDNHASPRDCGQDQWDRNE